MMPFLIGVCGLLAIAAVCLLSWRWMEIKGQIEIARAKQTRPIHERVDGLEGRLAEIESWVTGDDYQRGMKQLSNDEAIAYAVALMPPNLQEKWKKQIQEGQDHGA